MGWAELVIFDKTPCVVVPLVGTTEQQIIDEANQAVADGGDVLEWRIDPLLAQHENLSIASLARSVVSGLLSGTSLPILLTIRSTEQGGQVSLTRGRYRLLMAEIMDVLMQLQVDPGRIGLDLEAQLDTTPALISEARDRGYSTVLSAHDPQETPAEEVMILQFEEMVELGADVVKYVVSARTDDDVERLYTVLDVIRTWDKPFVSYAQSPVGRRSRAGSIRHGASGAYVAAGHPSHPRLITAAQLRDEIAHGLE